MTSEWVVILARDSAGKVAVYGAPGSGRAFRSRATAERHRRRLDRQWPVIDFTLVSLEPVPEPET